MIKILGFKNLILLSSFIAGLFILSQVTAQPEFQTRKKDDFDRLDGRGKSGKKVDVIEFAGNLEIHVYPGGSTLGLSIRLDKRNKKKPVAVIAYRFNSAPNTPLIRRVIISIPLNENFKVYRDRTITEYDKFIITNHDLDKQLAKVKLDSPPKHLYPKEHPKRMSQKKFDGDQRTPAKTSPQQNNPPVDENSTIKPFSW